jgi:hypothetical protein
MVDNCVGVYQSFFKDNGTIISTALSIITLFITGGISCLALRRTSVYQKYEYKIRLQLLNARVALGSKSMPDAVFSYSAKLENTGLKPVEIIRVDISCGLIDDAEKREIKTIVGRTYLKSGESVDINYKLTNNDVKNIMEKHSIEQCAVFIIIYYKDHKGNIIDVNRLLGGLEKPNVNIFVLQDGNAVT